MRSTTKSAAKHAPNRWRSSVARRAATGFVWLLLLHAVAAPPVAAYGLNYVVADMRQPAAQSGPTACPQRMHWNVNSSGGINRQWSTSLGTNPTTIVTASQTTAGQLNEVEATISQALGAWSGVAGSALTPNALAPLTRTAAENACAADGLNTICLNQSDPAFATGVLAFTRVVVADIVGEQVAAVSPPSTFVGQILDADVLVRPADERSLSRRLRRCRPIPPPTISRRCLRMRSGTPLASGIRRCGAR